MGASPVLTGVRAPRPSSSVARADGLIPLCEESGAGGEPDGMAWGIRSAFGTKIRLLLLYYDFFLIPEENTLSFRGEIWSGWGKNSTGSTGWLSRLHYARSLLHQEHLRYKASSVPPALQRPALHC